MTRSAVALTACLLAGVAAPAESQEREPRKIGSEADLEGAIRDLDAPGTRMQALESLIEFAGFKLYEGSVSHSSGDARMDALQRRAAKAVHSCADIETVTKALDHSSLRLRHWGVIAFRVFHHGEERDPAWLALVPRLEEIAACPDNSGLRGAAVSKLRCYPEAREFLARRAEVETSPDVLMRLVRHTTGYRKCRDRVRELVHRRLLLSENESVRIGALRFIGFDSQRAEMWQFGVGSAMFDRIIELARSRSASERSAAAYALDEAKAHDPVRSREAFLRLARDPSPHVRWRAAHGLAGELHRDDVRRVMDALLEDESPRVRFFAVLADGERKHIDELKALARCEDKQLAQMAAARVTRLVKDEATAEEEQGGQGEGVGEPKGKTGADPRGR